MDYVYVVRESGSFEFWGTLSDCQAYILANQFKHSFFTIERV